MRVTCKAIAEYAPGSEVIADGKLYKSRYIRMESVQKRTAAYGYYAKCKTCDEYNFTRNLQVRTTGQECISCGTKIPGKSWIKTIEPRLGFITDKADAKEAPMARQSVITRQKIIISVIKIMISSKGKFSRLMAQRWNCSLPQMIHLS